MTRKQINITVLILFTFCSLVQGQQTALDTLVKLFDQYRVQNLQEKIYVHFDKTSYMTGEYLRFNIYCLDGSLHKPLEISKVAYLEIIDASGKPVIQTKIELKKGLGAGSVFIPATVNSGNFTVRAYTSWMKNFDSDFFYHQRIAIINPFKKLDLINTKNILGYDAQFLPEGGNLLADEKSKIAFRVIDKNGKGIDFNGAVLNNFNDTVIHFNPRRFGIGNFVITPSTNEKYRIVLKDKQGKVSTFPFPDVSAEGYQLQVTESEKALQISVKAKLNTSDQPYVYLFVHTRNKIALAEIKFLKNESASFLINKEKLSDGVSHITLFSSNMQPVCERLYFKIPENKLIIDGHTDQPSYGIRRKVNLSIQTSDQKNNPLTSNVSVSVSKIDSLSFFPHTGIVDYLLLSSDLKGEIESPEYYFKNDPGIPGEIDNLMLTHGWRKFKWTAILSREKPSNAYLAEFHGHIIRGSVRKEDGSPAAGIKTYLASPSKITRVYGSISDSNGNVQFVVKNFTGPKKIFLQTDWEKDSTFNLSISNPFSEKPSALRSPVLDISKNLERQILEHSISMQVQDIYHGDQIQIITKPLSDSSSFFGTADETYKLDDFTRFPVMEEVMREYVPGVWVRKRGRRFIFKVLDTPNKGLFQENPLVLIDGVPVFNIDKIMAFDPLKVKKLEVITKKYYLGSLIFQGIVSYSTYTGDLAGFQPDRRSVTLDYEGLQLQREFYTPKYATRQQLDSRIPDQRNVLFWAPTIEIKNGKAEIEFYSSDLTGDFGINIQGITKEGLPGSFVGSFSVKKLNY